MKLEIDETKVNSLNKEELKEHLSLVEKSVRQLNEHAYNVMERIFALEVAETEAKWPVKEGEKVKVTYKSWSNSDNVMVGFFSRFGRPETYTWEKHSVFCVIRLAKKDGSMGKRTDQVLASKIKSIEPCE